MKRRLRDLSKIIPIHIERVGADERKILGFHRTVKLINKTGVDLDGYDIAASFDELPCQSAGARTNLNNDILWKRRDCFDDSKRDSLVVQEVLAETLFGSDQFVLRDSAKARIPGELRIAARLNNADFFKIEFKVRKS